MTLSVISVIGCRTASLEGGGEILPPPRQGRGPDLPRQASAAIQVDLDRLPILDPRTMAVTPRPETVRGLTETDCWYAAVAFPPPPDLFEPGFAQPWLDPAACQNCGEATKALLRDARESIDAATRNTAAGLALEDFYRLADVEARAELLRSALATLEELQQRTEEARGLGVSVPVLPEDLDRQRLSLLRLLYQSELGLQLLNIRLKRRMALPGTMPERLWPKFLPEITVEPIDVAGEIQRALSQRPDLRLLRMLYLRLDPETLPAVREILHSRLDRREAPARPLSGLILGLLAERRRFSEYDAVARAEVAVLRQQLADLIALRERQTADEIRSVAAILSTQLRHIAIARWNLEQLRGKAASPSSGVLAQLAAKLEAAQAEIELIEAVMAWHQAKLRLRITRGEFAQPPSSSPVS